MIMEFQKSKRVYFVLLAITCLLVIVLFIPRIATIAGEPVYVSLLTGNRAVQSVALRWILTLLGLFLAQMVSSAIASSVGNREFQKIAAVLLQRCDSTAFFLQAGPLFQTGSRQAAVVKDYLIGKGYLATGAYEQAVALWEKAREEADVEWITHDMRVSLCGVCANACIGYVEAGQYDAAVKLYSRLKALADAAVNHREAFASAERLCLATRAYIAAFAKEGYNDTAAIGEHIEQAKNEYDRVLLHYALARLCERLNLWEEAERSYRYVAANGNTFVWAAAAKERLQACGK